MSTAKRLGSLLAQVRWSKHLTTQELASITELNAPFIRAVEAGQVDMDLMTLQLLCLALDIEVRDLMSVLDQVRLNDSAIQLDHLFNLPKPCTAGDYQAALQWYELRKKRFAWLRKKREQQRSKRQSELQKFRTLRNSMFEMLNRSDKTAN
jgi:transcriptional regulator with XRE-family HTH domain